MKVFADDQKLARKVIKSHHKEDKMTQRIFAAKYLLEKLDGNLECHSDVYRLIPGMKSETASRRLREWKNEFENILPYLWAYICHYNHFWTFSPSFINWLKKQTVGHKYVEEKHVLHN